MAKVNVYLPDDLEQAVRAAGLSLSPICQSALRDAVEVMGALRASGDGRGRFTPRLIEIIDDVAAASAARGRQVTALELLCGIIKHGENLGARTLTMLGVDLPEPKRSSAAKGGGELARDAREVLASAYRVSLEMKHPHVGTEHVVIALADDGSPAADLFAALGLDGRNLRQTVERLIANPWSTERTTPEVKRELIDRFEIEVQRLADEIGRLRTELE
jgi:ATP-dependent Clp protease ATP-binding subunit ClpC